MSLLLPEKLLKSAKERGALVKVVPRIMLRAADVHRKHHVHQVAADVHALFVLQDRVSAQSDNRFGNTDVRSKWGRLEPGKSKYSLQASSLNAAYQMMKDKGLAPVPLDCQVGSVGTEKYGQKYFASGYPLPECPSQTAGLVAAHQRKPEGKGDEGRCVFFGREPWQITIDESDGSRCTWPLIKIAQPHHITCLKDGKSEANKALAGLHSPNQKFCIDPAKVGNIIKRKRKKKMTEAKRLQLQNAKLFRISATRKQKQQDIDDDCRKGGGNSTGHTGVAKVEKRKKKQKGRKGMKKSKEQHTKTQPKKHKNKYLHFQEFLETRRWKRRKCTLDPMAEVMMMMMKTMMMILQKKTWLAYWFMTFTIHPDLVIMFCVFSQWM